MLEIDANGCKNPLRPAKWYTDMNFLSFLVVDFFSPSLCYSGLFIMNLKVKISSTRYWIHSSYVMPTSTASLQSYQVVHRTCLHRALRTGMGHSWGMLPLLAASTTALNDNSHLLYEATQKVMNELRTLLYNESYVLPWFSELQIIHTDIKHLI